MFHNGCGSASVSSQGRYRPVSSPETLVASSFATRSNTEPSTFRRQKTSERRRPSPWLGLECRAIYSLSSQFYRNHLSSALVYPKAVMIRHCNLKSKQGLLDNISGSIAF
ncbi:hypothetical protein CGRA01v4_00839 [Colletotrichum graminicola]|nr:hypothetical protein CGRA01v4_00839 [Colletotrichum graminicola]